MNPAVQFNCCIVTAPGPSMVPPDRLTVASVAALLKINVALEGTIVVALRVTVPLNAAVPLKARVPVPLNWELVYVPPVSDSVAPAAIWNAPVLFVPDVPIERV